MTIANMKSILLSFILTLTLSAVLSAQIKIGVNVGVHSTLSGSNADGLFGFEFLDEKNPKIGIQTGLIAEYVLTDKFSIQSGINYIHKSIELGGWFNISDSSDYLNIPLRIKYNVANPFYIAVGGGVSSTISNINEEWELSGEIGLNITKDLSISSGFRQNLSYSGAIPLFTPNNIHVGSKGFKFRSLYLRANYSL